MAGFIWGSFHEKKEKDALYSLGSWVQQHFSRSFTTKKNRAWKSSLPFASTKAGKRHGHRIRIYFSDWGSLSPDSRTVSWRDHSGVWLEPALHISTFISWFRRFHSIEPPKKMALSGFPVAQIVKKWVRDRWTGRRRDWCHSFINLEKVEGPLSAIEKPGPSSAGPLSIRKHVRVQLSGLETECFSTALRLGIWALRDCLKWNCFGVLRFCPTRILLFVPLSGLILFLSAFRMFFVCLWKYKSLFSSYSSCHWN